MSGPYIRASTHRHQHQAGLHPRAPVLVSDSTRPVPYACRNGRRILAYTRPSSSRASHDLSVSPGQRGTSNRWCRSSGFGQLTRRALGNQRRWRRKKHPSSELNLISFTPKPFYPTEFTERRVVCQRWRMDLESCSTNHHTRCRKGIPSWASGE
jgi:hypothetical protein